jgi:hypothetical protein
MAAAINASGAQPSLSVTLSDPRVIPSLFASSGAQDNLTRTNLCLDPGGTILETLTDQGASTSVQLRRITSPTTAAQWTAAPTTIATGAVGSAGARIFAVAGTARLVYQRAVDSFPVYRDSTDVGVTWGAETVLGPGSLPLALGNFIDDFTWAGSVDTIWVICRAWANSLQGASGMLKTIRTGGVWGAWAPEGPLTSTWGQMRRVSSLQTTAGNQLFLAGMMRRNTLSGFGAAYFTRSAGAFNSAPTFLQDMDNPNLGLTYAWSAADGNATNGYWAAATLVDDGSISTNARQLTTVYFSPAPGPPSDRSWQQLCSLNSPATPAFGFGICADAATGLVYLAGKTQVWTIPMVPGVVVTDVSADVLSLHVSERPNQPARAKLLLANPTGAYGPTAYPGVQIQISLGYNATTLLCWTMLVEDTRNLGVGDTLTAEWDLLDASLFLSRISQRFMALSSYTLTQLLTFLANLANLTITIPVTPPFSQVVPCLVIKPGESPLDALNRLAALYDFFWQLRSNSAILITDPQPADAVTWTYAQETLAVAYGSVVDQPNLIRVIGDTSAHWADVQDDASILATGQVVSRLIVDRLLTSSAMALVRAKQALRQEQIHAAHAQLTVTVNPQLELNDVIQVTDARAGLAAKALRVESITTAIDWQNGSWEQHLELTNP